MLLQSVHSVLSTCPLPHLSKAFSYRSLETLRLIGSSENIVKLVQYNPTSDPYTAPHPVTPGGVVMLVSEIANVILTGSLLPATSVDQAPFARACGLAEVIDTVQADHIRRLLAEPLGAGEQYRLGLTGQGETGLKALEQEATRWLADIMEPVVDDRAADRRDSLFTLGGAAVDEEVELTVTVLVSRKLCILSPRLTRSISSMS